MWYVLLAALLLLTIGGARAHDPDDEFADWYQSLKTPGSGISCCSQRRDCQPVVYYRASLSIPGGYEAIYQGEWVEIPPEAVLQRADNPTGFAVLCVMRIGGDLVARCFVRSSES